jgi:hypothetical protein
MSEGEHQSGEEMIQITIDRHVFRVAARPVSGAQLRQLPIPPIGDDRDLFQVFSGARADLMVPESQAVDFENGTDFFSTPRSISAG